jgi:hypothetical protein
MASEDCVPSQLVHEILVNRTLGLIDMSANAK